MATEGKPIVWIGSSRDDLKGFPEPARKATGFALRVAQEGEKHPDAKPLKGFGGASVLEVVESYDGDTYRSVYTVKFAEALYVLHCFQKIKIRNENATERYELDRDKIQDSETGTREMARKAENEKVTRGSGNVFRDLGFRNADEMLAKADLVIQISRVMSARKMTQMKLAETIGIDQPAVSKLLRGHTDGYTTDRLMKILNQLGHDVEITVRPKPTTAKRAGAIFVRESLGKAHVYARSAASSGKAKKSSGAKSAKKK